MINETVFDSPAIALDEFETGNRRRDIHLNLEPTSIEGSQPYCSTSTTSSVDENLAKHARFNIEKVVSPTQHDHHQNQSTLYDMETIGYATHEAVPLTMFYRNESSNPGISKQRPTLDELHKGLDELDEEVCLYLHLNPVILLSYISNFCNATLSKSRPINCKVAFLWFIINPY